MLGIGKIRAAAVGKVGGLALGYFLVMSTVALGIGLLVGNIIAPGTGLDIPSDPSKAADLADRGRPDLADAQHHRAEDDGDDHHLDELDE
nr:cation:dicarboxylase symporter family transporter [Mycobacterium sp. 1274761.0]